MVLKHSVELSSVVDAVSSSLVTPCTLLSSTCLLLYPALSLCLLKGRPDCGDLTPLGAAISQKWMGVRGQAPQLLRPSREELRSWFFIISQSSPGGAEGHLPHPRVASFSSLCPSPCSDLCFLQSPPKETTWTQILVSGSVSGEVQPKTVSKSYPGIL